MDSVFETRTLKLSYDLLKDVVPSLTRQAVRILWDDVLFSRQFHTELTQKITSTLKQEYGLISQDVYDGNQKAILDIAAKTAGDYAADSTAVWKLGNVGADLGKKLDEIAHHFNHTKAGIWVDEHENTVTVIVSVLIIGGAYGLYSFRNTQAFEYMVNGADLLGLASKSIHVGGVKLNGKVSNYSISTSTVKLGVSASKKWKAVQAKIGSSGVINFNTGEVVKTTADVNLQIPINRRLTVSGGLSAAGKDERVESTKVYINANFSPGPAKIKLNCSITDNHNATLDKGCSASVDFKF